MLIVCFNCLFSIVSIVCLNPSPSVFNPSPSVSIHFNPLQWQAPTCQTRCSTRTATTPVAARKASTASTNPSIKSRPTTLPCRTRPRPRSKRTTTPSVREHLCWVVLPVVFLGWFPWCYFWYQNVLLFEGCLVVCLGHFGSLAADRFRIVLGHVSNCNFPSCVYLFFLIALMLLFTAMVNARNTTPAIDFFHRFR